HVPRIAEEIGGAPQQLHAGRLLKLLRVRDHLVEVAVRLAERAAFRGDVAIMEAPEGRLDLLEKLERGIEPALGVGDVVLRSLPRPADRARAERIGAGAAERVPVRDREAQVLLQRAAVDHLGRVVVPEGEGVRRTRAFVGDGPDLREVGFRGGFLFGGHGVEGSIAGRVKTDRYSRRPLPDKALVATESAND